MRVHHIALRTRDVARLERFYVGVLGLEVKRRDGDRAVWIAAGEIVIMLERADDLEPSVDLRTKDLLAFTVEDLAPWRAMDGIAVEGSTAYTLYFRDPDGRRVGVSTYRFER